MLDGGWTQFWSCDYSTEEFLDAYLLLEFDLAGTDFNPLDEFASVYAELAGTPMPQDYQNLMLEIARSPLGHGVWWLTADQLEDIRFAKLSDVGLGPTDLFGDPDLAGLSLGGELILLQDGYYDHIFGSPAPTYDEIVCQWDTPAKLGTGYQSAFRAFTHELWHAAQYEHTGSTYYYGRLPELGGELEDEVELVEAIVFEERVNASHPLCPVNLAPEQLIVDNRDPDSLSLVGSVNQTALYARRYLRLNDRAEVFSNGFMGYPSGCVGGDPVPSPGALFSCFAGVASGDSAYLGTDTHVSDIAADGFIELRDRATVGGSAFGTQVMFLNNGITVEQGTFEGAGSFVDSLGDFAPPFPSNYTFTVNYLPPNSSVSLPPGEYQTMDVTPGTTVFLGPGTYYFGSLTLQSHSRLLVDPAGGPVRIFVEGYLSLKGTIEGPDALYATWRNVASNVLIGYEGSAPVILDSGSRLLGTLVAPNAFVSVQPFVHVGAVYADQIEVHQDTNWWFEPFMQTWLP